MHRMLEPKTNNRLDKANRVTAPISLHIYLPLLIKLTDISLINSTSKAKLKEIADYCSTLNTRFPLHTQIFVPPNKVVRRNYNVFNMKGSR